MIQKNKELFILKTILWVYIILCVLVAGLNYGFASRADSQTAAWISWFWHFYENWVKTIIIVAGAFLTARIIRIKGKNTLRSKNLIVLILSALAIHIILPLALNNSEIYFFSMPLPWTTTPLRLMDADSSFYMSHASLWGVSGVLAILIAVGCISAVVYVGTLLYGRRWQCSMLCMFNGFASEVFAPAFPLLGKKKNPGKRTLRIFRGMRWIFLGLAVFFTLWWVLFLTKTAGPEGAQVIESLETVKYLSAELLLAMFFWVAFIGRGYCFYCPLGTVLSYLARAAGQKIITDRARCVSCGSCNKACPMAIDIESRAKDGLPVADLRCVGCGHCLDACPVKCLEYSTKMLNRINCTRKKKKTVKVR